jgi:hypothetical protein
MSEGLGAGYPATGPPSLWQHARGWIRVAAVAGLTEDLGAASPGHRRLGPGSWWTPSFGLRTRARAGEGGHRGGRVEARRTPMMASARRSEATSGASSLTCPFWRLPPTSSPNTTWSPAAQGGAPAAQGAAPQPRLRPRLMRLSRGRARTQDGNLPLQAYVLKGTALSVSSCYFLPLSLVVDLRCLV